MRVDRRGDSSLPLLLRKQFACGTRRARTPAPLKICCVSGKFRRSRWKTSRETTPLVGAGPCPRPAHAWNPGRGLGPAPTERFLFSKLRRYRWGTAKKAGQDRARKVANARDNHASAGDLCYGAAAFLIQTPAKAGGQLRMTGHGRIFGKRRNVSRDDRRPVV